MRSFQDWTQDAKHKFREVLSSGNTKSLIEEYVNTEFANVNTVTNKVTAILNSAIEKVFSQKRRKAKKLINQNRHYSYECQLAKKALKKAQRQPRNNSENLNRRLIYIKEKGKYGTFVKKFIKNRKTTAIHLISSLEYNDPKCSWKKIKQMINPNEDNTKYISPEKWSCHFRNLVTSSGTEGCDRQFLDYIKSSLSLLERLADHSEYLNGDISLNEIQNENLKNGKAMYIDDIPNEALKAGSDNLKRPIRHLFNRLYKNSVFPDLWCDVLLYQYTRNTIGWMWITTEVLLSQVV